MAGLDEVGRGAWAGPVSVGVVVFPVGRRPPKGLCDSKLLAEERAGGALPLVTEWCDDWSVGHADPVECDRLGMTAALRSGGPPGPCRARASPRGGGDGRQLRLRE